MSTSQEQAGIVADRLRLWEVRKYCQIRPVDGHNSVGDAKPHEKPPAVESSPPDAALSSLLQILRERLHADVAFVSLLDEETQFFLAGARKEDSHSAGEPAKWFGCDQVAHHGGLCERAIAVDSTQRSAIYEELDMAESTSTKGLDFVDGTLASFRSYAGAPLRTAAGICIGTVFTMSENPSLGLNASQHQLLIDTADHVMRQLTLTLQALEGERLMQFQSATAALHQLQRPSLHRKERMLPRKLSGLEQQPSYVVEVYQHAAEVMRKSLQLDGVLFQHVPSDSHNGSGSWQDLTLATSRKAETSQTTIVLGIGIAKIIQAFSRGSVLHHLDGGWYMSTSEESRPMLDPEIRDALDESFNGSRQLLVMPLFDVLHNRTAAVCFGWLNGYTRVYSDRSDLPFVSGFCMSTMSEVLRLETQMLERVKADFIGSVSHEMKTPLHQTLGNLELLLQTSCSNEQRDLAIDARFGTTQLLETIDKILQYASISSESDVNSVAISEADMIISEREAPQIIGPRMEHVAGAATTVDLVRMCEEVVEETTKRMRLLETIMSPSEQESQEQEDGVPYSELSALRVDAMDKDPFTIVVFDSCPIESVKIPRNTGFRIVLENLLSNAIKFTRPGRCVRVCLQFSSTLVELIVSDCGYGMSEDFIRHNIYLPFAQQDPVASGMDLGLSLVKRNVDSLGGTVNIETDQAAGTTAKISVQTRDLMMGAEAHIESVPLGIVPTLPERPRDNLPFMHACFYAPSMWIHRYDKRDKRSIDLVFDSLSSTLSEWYQPVLSLWQRQKKRTIPDLIFISQRNLADFERECGDDFANVKKVIICAAVGRNSSQDRERIRHASTIADALITGAVLPSKLWKVVTSYFPHILQPGASASVQKPEDGSDGTRSECENSEKETSQNLEEDSDSLSKTTVKEPDHEMQQHPDIESGKQVDNDERSKKADAVGTVNDEKTQFDEAANATSEDESPASRLQRTLSVPAMDASKGVLRRTMTVPVLQRSEQPHLLLVDDNSINLKMLGMFVNKCAIPAARSTSVIGGQEAIEAYKAFKGKNSMGKGFDIILMDLSMPEVSGFDATSSIRQIERGSGDGYRSYIVALTGLTSDKDRCAAFDAGVDDYVTKPAGLRNVRSIIEAWQKKKHESGG